MAEKWLHKPAHNALAEHWVAEAAGRPIAMLWADENGAWHLNAKTPTGQPAALAIAGAETLNEAQSEAEQTLRELGWKST